MLMMGPDLIRILHAHDNCPNELFNICLCAAAVIVGDNGQCVPQCPVLTSDGGRNFNFMFCPMWSIDMYDEYGGYDVCVLMVVAGLREQNKFCFNWIEECAGAGAGHWRGRGTRHHQQTTNCSQHNSYADHRINGQHLPLFTLHSNGLKMIHIHIIQTYWGHPHFHIQTFGALASPILSYTH